MRGSIDAGPAITSRERCTGTQRPNAKSPLVPAPGIGDLPFVVITYSTTAPTSTAGSGACSARLSLKMSSSVSPAASVMAFSSSVCTVPFFVTTRAVITGRSSYHGAHSAETSLLYSIDASSTMR